MKKFLFFILIFAFSVGHSQNLANSEWIKILSERKDGSKITDGLRRDKVIDNLFFKDTTVLISVNHQYSSELHFSIKDGVLTIGNFLKFSIDTVNNIVLEISEISNKSMPDSELNTYAFINSAYLFEYRKEKNQLQIIGDSLIQCNNQFSPTYGTGDLSSLLRMPFRYREDSVVVSGYFLLGAKKKITDVHLNPSSMVSEKQAKAFEKAIKRTGKSWILPITDKPYIFKIDFRCFFKTKFQIIPKDGHSPAIAGQFYTADIRFYPNDSSEESFTGL